MMFCLFPLCLAGNLPPVYCNFAAVASLSCTVYSVVCCAISIHFPWTRGCTAAFPRFALWCTLWTLNYLHFVPCAKHCPFHKFQAPSKSRDFSTTAIEIVIGIVSRGVWCSWYRSQVYAVLTSRRDNEQHWTDADIGSCGDCHSDLRIMYSPALLDFVRLC